MNSQFATAQTSRGGQTSSAALLIIRLKPSSIPVKRWILALPRRTAQAFSALLFSDFGRFEVLGRKAGLLLCMGITADELAACKEGRREEVEQALREQGVYPFTDLHRKSVLTRRVGEPSAETAPRRAG